MIPSLFIGTWQHGLWSEQQQKTKYEDIYRCAIDNGLRAFDTAAAYGKGEAEKLLGKILKPYRDSSYIASKFSPQHSKPKLIRWSLEHSLRNLQTEYLDLFIQHWPSPKRHVDETIETLLQLKEEGKIRAIGVSNWREHELKECTLVENIDVIQNCYHIFWRHDDALLKKYSHLHYIAYSPLSSGLLRIFEQEECSVDNLGARIKHVRFNNELTPNLSTFIKKLEAIAAREKTSTHDLALRWIKAQKQLHGIVLGFSNKNQLLNNLQACSEKISEDLFAELEDLSLKYKQLHEDCVSSWNFHPRLNNS